MKNKKNHVDKTECNDHVMQSMLNANSVFESISNALVKHSVKTANSKSLCAIYNKCLFNANNDMCLIECVNDMNMRSKAKPKKNKKRKVWKPMGKVFNNIIYSWKLVDLEVAFCKHTCFIRDLEGVDIVKGSRGSNLYTLSLENLMLSSPICLMLKASKTKSWLWHQRLSHLNFDYINSLAKQGLVRGLPKLKYQKDHLCSACALGKSKKHSHKPKAEDSIQEKLYLLHMDLCGPMRVQSINGRKYILVIVDDFSWFTWVKFIRLKDEVPEFQAVATTSAQRNNEAFERSTWFEQLPLKRTDNGIEFVNQTLRAYYKEMGISHQTSVVLTPQQNGFVEIRNCTLVEAARTIVDLQVPVVIAIEHVVSTNAPSSTTIDQDAPSTSTS
nr:retrovirus-related Pol polyprotein from transposon TNT 1-94 [Tanacetum cinerariifolium]